MKIRRTLAAALLLAATLLVSGTTLPAAAKPTKTTKTYTHKATYRDPHGKVVTGIRTDTGRLFVGYDTVTETIDPTVVEMAPDSASATTFRRMAYVEDQATWTGSNDSYYYIFALRASIGWQSQPDGTTYYTRGPYQYREAPSCSRKPRTGGTEVGISCNFQFNSSALMAKHCAAPSSCTLNVPWGFRDFYQANVVSVLFAGGWHLAGSYEFDGALQSCTADATARFLIPNHVTAIYFAGSFWWSIKTYPANNEIASDACTGLTKIS